MYPGNYDLGLYRGDTSRLQFVLWQDASKTIPVDLTGATATAQIRDGRDSPNVTADLACSIALPNTVNVTVPAAGASNLHSRGVWDLQLTWPSGDIQTIVTGTANAQPDVTRAVA